MFQIPEFELHGRDVVLRPLTRAHAPELAAAAAESREHYLYNRVPDGLSDTQSYVDSALTQRASGKRFPFVVEWRGRVVGTTSYAEYEPWSWPAGSPLQRVDRPDAVEVGYTWLSGSAQRTGCNTEAKRLLLSHAFETWQVHRVTIYTDARNQRSRRAIERLGASLDGILRGHRPGVDGSVRNSALYSIMEDEWPAVRERLMALSAPREP
jgi:RimJ/RimL family protein N-acetyltransferase